MKNNIVNRYLSTKKGKNIIVASMMTPIKFCRMKYINDQPYYLVEGKYISEEEKTLYANKKQREIHLATLQKLSLTEDDLILSEEKLLKIKQEEQFI